MSKERNRKQALNLHDHKYRRINGIRGEYYWNCVYCGVPADTIEHFPPITRFEDYNAINESGIYIKFPCCQQCNSIAGDTLDDSLLDRIERVKDKLARKYSRYIKPAINNWTNEELEELDRNLVSKILEGSKKSEIYTKRINYYDGIDSIIDQICCIFGIDNLN